MRRQLRLVFFSLGVTITIFACGSRTGLVIDELTPNAGTDARPDRFGRDDVTVDRTADSVGDMSIDTSFDGPILFEGGKLDVQVDCATPSTCDKRDPGFVYKCGVRVEQCSSIETCAEIGEVGASCVNPCVDTLGQDTSNGCEFFAMELDTSPTVVGSCFAVFVVNQWKTGEPARIQVDRGGTILPIDQFARIPVGTGTSITYAPYSSATGLAKDEVAILFLSRDPAADSDPDPTNPRRLAACPAGVTPAVLADAAIHGTGTGTSFHIKTNVPVVAYQMLPYGGGRARVTAATLLLPTNVWDNNYLAANAYTAPTMIPGDGPTLAILGQSDNTQVTIRPVKAILGGGGLAGTPADTPVTYRVDRGQYLQLTQNEELTGSAIQSDKPIAVIGGNTLVDIPVAKTRADSAEQMLPPVRSLGSEYVAVRYRNRANRGEEVVPWRMIGAVDGTVLSYDPPQLGAPTALGARQLLEFSATGPFVVRSQDANHPFYLAQYMTGGKITTTPDEQQIDGEGDPEFVNAIAPAQYLPRYTFFTDPTYPETNLVIVRVKDAQTGVFPDVTLDCAGALGGWASVGSGGTYQFTRVDLSSGNFEGQNGCNNGVHTIQGSFSGLDAGSLNPLFGVTVWGWGNPITYAPFDNQAQADPRFTRWVSYGYPAGANIKALNSVVVPAN